jgi:tetratricopeptide (TPR) repeat protein
MTEPEAVSRQAPASAAVFLATFAFILLAMAGLFAVDLFLAGLERRELRSEARHLYEEGMSLARGGRQLQAVDRFQSAVAAERSNPVYQRALADAMLTAGKPAEARAIAAAQLQREPTDAAASLLVARSLVREGNLAEAVPYYHRAIYGFWDQDPAANRVRSRFELVDLLARIGAQRELLAELLPLQGQAPTDYATRRRIAHLFLDAGAPSRAIEIFRALLREHGRDADTYAGLGEAELARANYRSARANFAAAAQLSPDDSTIARRLALAQRVIGLDPTQRGIGSEERYHRSIELLGLTVQAADRCLAADTSGANRGIVDSARAAMAAPRRRSTTRHEAVELNLNLAERLWELRRSECPALPTAAEEPVALVLERVKQ